MNPMDPTHGVGLAIDLVVVVIAAVFITWGFLHAYWSTQRAKARKAALAAEAAKTQTIKS